MTTEAVNFDLISRNISPTQSYGRQLPATCGIRDSNGSRGECVFEAYDRQTLAVNYAVNPSGMYDVLNNQSATSRLSTLLFQGKRLSYIAPSAPVLTLDYKATTIASYSDCHSATHACHANSTYFECSNMFNTTTTGDGWYGGKSSGNIAETAIFPRPDLTWTNDTSGFTLLPDPFYSISHFVIFGEKTPGAGVDAIGKFARGKADTGGLEFFLGCTTSFSNLTYTSIDNTVVALSNVPITDKKIVFALAEINFEGRGGYLQGQILTGGLAALHQKTSARANEAFASQYDATFLAAAASVCENAPNLKEQTRTTILVARVHKLALLALILTLLVSTLFGLLLVSLAVFTSEPRGPIPEAQAPQPNGPDPGSVSIADLFEEYVGAKRTDRLGVFRTERGKWEYVCQIPETKTLRLVDTEKAGEVLSQGLGLFGIPIVKLASAGGSLSESLAELSDEEEIQEGFLGAEKMLKSGEYQAL